MDKSPNIVRIISPQN